MSTKVKMNNTTSSATLAPKSTKKSVDAKLSTTPNIQKSKSQLKQPTSTRKKSSKKPETTVDKIQIVVTKDKKSSKSKKQTSSSVNASQSSDLLLDKSLKQGPTRGRRRSSSAIELRKNTTTYAGPTFNNAPAPSSIPIPPALSPTLVSIELMKREKQEEYLDLEKHSQEMINQFSSRPPLPPHQQQQQQQLYKSHSHHFYNQLHNRHFHKHYPYDKDLSEIQRDLRSLLKI